eukprot:Skav217264  [mRNA]  locus=scaffold47:1366792:1369395:- [translate_table: standard]
MSEAPYVILFFACFGCLLWACDTPQSPGMLKLLFLLATAAGHKLALLPVQNEVSRTAALVQVRMGLPYKGAAVLWVPEVLALHAAMLTVPPRPSPSPRINRGQLTAILPSQELGARAPSAALGGQVLRRRVAWALGAPPQRGRAPVEALRQRGQLPWRPCEGAQVNT